MKKSFVILLLISYAFSNAQYTSIPHLIFEQILIDKGIDSDNQLNGQVLTSDINNVVTLEISNIDNIIDFTGIESFTALETLKLTFIFGIVNFNVNNNLLLKTLIIYDCGVLLSLDVSNNIALETLTCGFASLYEVNISNNINLVSLSFSENNLTNIDISNNPMLKKFYCVSNNLIAIDVTNNPLLETLDISENDLTNINLSQNLLLKTLRCSYNLLSSIDVSNNSLLEDFSCSENQINFLNLNSNNSQLKKLICSYNQLTSLNLSNNNQLTYLHCGYNQLTLLDLSNNTQLGVLVCHHNYINSLELNNNSFTNSPIDTDYPFINCSYNNLSELYLQNGNNTLLNGVNTYNQLRFNATNNPNLTCIYVDDVANCSANWLGVDSSSHFVSTTQECEALATESFDLKKITLFPNPAQNIFSIENSNNETIKSIMIYDYLGKEVLKQISNNKVDISNLVNGIYLVKIETEKGSFTEKLIKR